MMDRFGWLFPLFALAACGEADRGGDGPVEEAAIAVEGSEPAPPATTASRASSFTQLDDGNCAAAEVIEETGDWDRRCKGAGGYDLEWSSGDLREELTLVRGGKSTGLDIPTKVAGGAFDSIGKVVEWRGVRGGAPDVLITRVHVADAEGKNDSGRLAVVRLGDAPCIVAVVPPAAGQSERARGIADGKLPDCLVTAD